MVDEDVDGVRMAPAGSVPPTGGGWWLYHSFSAQLTMLAAPWVLAHSAKRELTELPRAGLSSAPPREKTIQTKTTARASRMTAATRRRR
jgi:hypothetical protein